MEDKKSTSNVEKHEIQGHHIQIRKKKKKEQLWIDGIQHKFFTSSDGYTLYNDAYSSPQKTLIQAVKIYLEKISKELVTSQGDK